jgi:hypothetical protein
MQSGARVVHLVLSVLFIAGLVVQVFLAGMGVFDGPERFETHRTWGYTLELFPVLLLIAALVGRMGRRLALLAVAEFGLFILQSVLIAFRESTPAVAALHPVNGFLILLIAIVITRESWLARGAGRGAEAAA